MNKRERVLAAVSGEAPDRVPSGFWLHFPKGYEAGEAAVQMHLHFFEKSGTDLCKVMNENSLPNNPALSAPDDWAKLTPIPHDAPFITRQVELVRRVCEEVKGQAVVLATIHGMVASAFHYLGGGELYDNDKLAVTRCLRENPTAFRHGMEIIADYLDFLCGACIEAGADGLYFASLGGETAMMTDDEFETFFKPYEVALLKRPAYVQGSPQPCPLSGVSRKGNQLGRPRGEHLSKRRTHAFGRTARPAGRIRRPGRRIGRRFV